MIGAGAIGLGTAWHLAQQGHDVSVYDPRLNQSVDREGSANDLSGTSASLGVLMGHVFRRSSGRGWRLRRRSMELWPQWIETLQAHQPDLKLHPGLLQIAEDEQAAERMEALAAQRVDLGLQMVTNADLAAVWPTARHGGLHSRHDGRVDPLLLQRALRQALAEQSVELNATAVIRLERNDNHWHVHRADGDSSVHKLVVLCTGPELGRLAGTAGPGPTDDTGVGPGPVTGTDNGSDNVEQLALGAGGSGLQPDSNRTRTIAARGHRGTGRSRFGGSSDADAQPE